MNSTLAALLRPGQAFFDILLAVFGINGNLFDPTLHIIFSTFIAISFWSLVLRFFFGIVSRTLGFYPGRRY